jgi:hypothetical protein
MARHTQNFPRFFRHPRPETASTPARSPALKALTPPSITIASIVLSALAIAVVVSIPGRTNNEAAQQKRSNQRVAKLLAGIPQHGHRLGYPNAPVTLEVFADLKDPDSRNWFDNYLPAILKQDVRTRKLQLRFHAFKTNTGLPAEFVDEQTAALSAGAQNKLWNYAEVFYHQQRNAPTHSEFESYATNNFLEVIARQIPGLDFSPWNIDRHTEHREELPSEESKTAREYQLHVTPSFRIGRTGRPLTNYAGSTILKYKGQHPISLIKAHDLNKTISELDPKTQ